MYLCLYTSACRATCSLSLAWLHQWTLRRLRQWIPTRLHQWSRTRLHQWSPRRRLHQRTPRKPRMRVVAIQTIPRALHLLPMVIANLHQCHPFKWNGSCSWLRWHWIPCWLLRKECLKIAIAVTNCKKHTSMSCPFFIACRSSVLHCTTALTKKLLSSCASASRYCIAPLPWQKNCFHPVHRHHDLGENNVKAIVCTANRYSTNAKHNETT